jgi:hypothetical protein
MEYEVIQEHEYQDIYRLTPGVLLKINKYKSSEIYWNWTDSDYHKKELSKVKGLDKCYKLKSEVITKFKKQTVPKDTIIFEQHIIVPIADKKDFFYELKTTGSCFSGNLEEFKELIEMINEVLNKY